MGCWDTKVFFGPPEQGLSVRQESIVDRAALAPSPKVCAHRMRAPESTRCWDIVVTSYSSCVLPKTKRRVMRDSAWPLSTCQYLCERLLHTPTLSCLGLGKSVILPPPHAYGMVTAYPNHAGMAGTGSSVWSGCRIVHATSSYGCGRQDGHTCNQGGHTCNQGGHTCNQGGAVDFK